MTITLILQTMLIAILGSAVLIFGMAFGLWGRGIIRFFGC